MISTGECLWNIPTNILSLVDFIGYKTYSHYLVKKKNQTAVLQKDLMTGEDFIKENRANIISSKISPVSRSISQRIFEWTGDL